VPTRHALSMVPLSVRQATALLSCLVLSGCQSLSPETSGDIKLGAAGAWTTAYGIMAHQGIDLAVAQINQSGGIDGRKIDVIFSDDQADGSRAADIARDFIADERILGVIGHLSSSAMVAAARVYDGELAALSPSSTSPDLSGISKWLFRLMPSDSMTGRKLGEIVRKQFGKRRVAVIYDNTSYGRGLVEPFLEGFELTPVAIEPIDPSGESVTVNVASIARQQPDLIFVSGTSSAGVAVLKAIRAAGITAPVMAGDGWSGIETMTEVQNVMVAVPFAATGKHEDEKRFVAAFRERFKAEPDAYAALSYDATIGLARAAAKGRTREGTRAALEATNESRGLAGGSMRFSAAGDPVGRSMSILTMNGANRTFGVIQ
jgi:branched-chain amino acid transport system substrate-binding protein